MGGLHRNNYGLACRMPWRLHARSVDRLLERRTSVPGVLGLNPAEGPSPRNFGNYVYPTLPASFGGRPATFVCLCHRTASFTYLVKCYAVHINASSL